MARRKVSTTQFREIILSRAIRGSSMSATPNAYACTKARVKARLDNMTIAEIEAVYDYLCQDLEVA